MGFFFLWTQERVRNIRGKRAISVRATEVFLYIQNLTKVKGRHANDDTNKPVGGVYELKLHGP